MTHARRVVAREGFTDFAGRPGRLQLFLDSYGGADDLETAVAELGRL